MPGSGPRRHDPPQRLIAPRRHRKTSLPASHRRYPTGSERPRCTTDLVKAAPSTSRRSHQIATPIFGPPPATPASASPAQDHAQPNPHRRQAAHLAPAGSFLGGFRPPAAAPVDRSRPAGIRNPSPPEPFTVASVNGRSGASCDSSAVRLSASCRIGEETFAEASRSDGLAVSREGLVARAERPLSFR